MTHWYDRIALVRRGDQLVDSYFILQAGHYLSSCLLILGDKTHCFLWYQQIDDKYRFWRVNPEKLLSHCFASFIQNINPST